MWKDIIGWEQYYQINENGDVRNKITNHIVAGDKNSEGYCRVCLYNKNHCPSKQRYFRHRLVAEHFINNPNKFPEVNHIDSNIENNNVQNLEWINRIDNEHHSRKFGNKEYKPFKVTYNDGRIINYEFKEELAKSLNVTRRTIANWLHKDNKGFEKYNIVEINYI